MLKSRSARAVFLAAVFAAMAVHQPLSGSAGQDRQQEIDRFPGVKEWTAEVAVTSDCDRAAFDGSRTAIHNRVVTTYQFTRRVTDAPVSTWRGRATTTYRWSVTMGTREGREVEESAASFEGDAELRIADSTKISTSRPPGRPFTKTKYSGDAIVDSTTSDDEPPTAELFDAPLPIDPATLSGRRTEASYSLFGGVVLTCPAQRQWNLHPVT